MAEAEQKVKTEERIYIIPLRKEFLKVPRYRRAGRATKTIKAFIAKHMKVPERDIRKVKLDIYLNQEVMHRGRTKPPGKIKVKVKKEGENFLVSLVETHQKLKFRKIRDSKIHKKAIPKPKTPIQAAQSALKPGEVPVTTQTPDKKEKTPEELKEEKEKSQSVAEAEQKAQEQKSREEKHVAKGKAPRIKRQALKK